MKKRYWMPLLAVLAVPLRFLSSFSFRFFGGHPSASERAGYVVSQVFNVTKGEFENRRPKLMENGQYGKALPVVHLFPAETV